MPDFCKKLYKRFGECLFITAGGFECAVTLGFGPRIIRFAPVGGENVYFEDENDEIVFCSANQGGAYGEKYGGDGWHIYGGHRLWAAPENPLVTYCPDNDAVTLELSGGGAELTQRAQAANGLRLRMTVALGDDGALRVTHSIENTSALPQRLAPWAVTAVRGGGLCVITQSAAKTSPLPNRRLILWPYTSVSDPRLALFDDVITIRHDASLPALKIGAATGGKAYYRRDNLLLEFDVPEDGGEYPNTVPLEVYSDKLYTEIEILGRLTTLAPGCAATLTTAQRLSVTASPNDFAGDEPPRGQKHGY